MKSSGFVSDGYLDVFRDYFKQADEAFRKDPINEGPPPGFDYDIVLLTQEPDLVIEKGNAVTIEKNIHLGVGRQQQGDFFVSVPALGSTLLVGLFHR